MMRFILPTIFIGLALAVFFIFVTPMYGEVQALKAEVSSYDQALANSKALEDERDHLTAKFNSIDQSNLVKLQKLLPENIDNIRLILELEQVALPYHMILKNVKYNSSKDQKKDEQPTNIAGGSVLNSQIDNRDYGTWDLEFSINGSYNDFLNFTRDLEHNLRIVDISSIQFSSNSPSDTTNPNAPESYQYNFKIKTYWLKN